eukprot:scaffold7342_cov269-Pinguiococcus_pyrenoidosus.AAC.8
MAYRLSLAQLVLDLAIVSRAGPEALPSLSEARTRRGRWRFGRVCRNAGGAVCGGGGTRRALRILAFPLRGSYCAEQCCQLLHRVRGTAKHAKPTNFTSSCSIGRQIWSVSALACGSMALRLLIREEGIGKASVATSRSRTTYPT